MWTLWRIISGPFKFSWCILNFIRKFILNIFLLVFITVSVGIYLQINHTPTIKKGALVMDLSGTVVDKPVIKNKVHQLSRGLLGIANNRIQENSLFDVVDILRQAKSDPNITGLVLSLKNFTGTDQESLQYIGKALREFRDSGKPIYAIGDSYSQAQYFLASYANKIYLTPHGVVELRGIATNKIYYKKLLDMLKVNSHIFRVGRYKSAVEPLLRNSMSEDARKADSRWINQLWKHYLTTVAANRKISLQQLFPDTQKMLDGLNAFQGNAAQFALMNKWVDEVAPRSSIYDTLTKIFGWNKDEKTFNNVSIYNYRTMMPSKKNKQIAVIFVSGAMIDGLETAGLVGGDTIAEEIRNARLNNNIKAIVLRVNTPGGSVAASETIRSELAATRAAGKPIVVSMGGIAASGGYWISTPANYIIANASTITGSIGVFGVINTIEDALDSIGVNTDGVTTSPLADVSATKALPLEFSQQMQLSVENSYRNFIDLVSQSRHKTLEEANKISQGHIWIGSDAAKNGLIDQLGDFDDAVNKAAELAQLKQYQLRWYLNEPSLLSLLCIQASSLVQTLLFERIQLWLSIPTQIINWIKINEDIGLEFRWNDPKKCYALCITCKCIIP